MSQRKKGIILSYIILGLDIIIGLFYTPYFLARIGDSSYGVFALSQSLLNFITLLDLGLGQTLVRYKSKYITNENITKEHQLNGLFLCFYTLIGLLSLLMGFLIIVFYPLLCSSSINSEEIALFRVVFGILLINLAISFPMRVFSGTLRAYEKFSVLKGITLISIILRYGITVILLIFGYKLIAATLVIFACSLLTELLNAFFCFKDLHIRFSFKRFEKSEFLDIIRFSSIIFVNLIIEFLFANTDKIILGTVNGTVAVTIYTLGIYFYTYFEQLSTSISGVFTAKISKLYDKNHDIIGLTQLFTRISYIQTIILFLFLGGFCVFGKNFIRLWVGNGYDDSYIIGLLIMVPAIIPLSQNLGLIIIKIMNLHNYVAKMYFVIAILNVVLSIPLAFFYEGIGCAVATCFATIAGQILYMNWFYSNKVGIAVYSYWINFLKQLLQVIILSLPFIILLQYINITNWLQLMAYISLYGAIYIIINLKKVLELKH